MFRLFQSLVWFSAPDRITAPGCVNNFWTAMPPTSMLFIDSNRSKFFGKRRVSLTGSLMLGGEGGPCFARPPLSPILMFPSLN